MIVPFFDQENIIHVIGAKHVFPINFHDLENISFKNNKNKKSNKAARGPFK
jgi:hypothetical protein